MDKILARQAFMYIAVLMSFIIVCSSGKSVAADEKNMIVIANGEWQPFISKNLKHYGVFCHILKEAFASEGVKVIYKWVPWNRAYVLTQRGEFDATAAWIPTSERKKHFYYSSTILVNQKVFFHLKSFRFDWRTIDDLHDINIGIVLGFTYGEKFDNAVKTGKLQVFRESSESKNFFLLLKGRIQIYPQEIDAGYAFINKYFSEKAALITHHPKTIIETTHHLILSKQVDKNRRLLELLNKGLRRLKESGKLDKYLEASRQGKYK
ncbi:MAG: transporter substrate-binding domain-containing protein [Desulfobacterales bacterium]|nr:transporter substrate-binding domain-containing protein [Desulfobacterales bacterium]MCP4162009.1 transporter substrate-binding domain-containing protein [Deltaproteobacteria bacterium]